MHRLRTWMSTCPVVGLALNQASRPTRVVSFYDLPLAFQGKSRYQILTKNHACRRLVDKLSWTWVGEGDDAFVLGPSEVELFGPKLVVAQIRQSVVPETG
jgi:hypothetical protein